MSTPEEPIASPGHGRRLDPGALRAAFARLDDLDPCTTDAAEALAFLLCRVADADHDVSSQESACIESILTALARVEDDQAVLVAEIAKHRERLADCASRYRVSRALRERASPGELATLLDLLVRVAAADGHLAPVEIAAVRQIAVELGFSLDQADARLGAPSAS